MIAILQIPLVDIPEASSVSEYVLIVLAVILTAIVGVGIWGVRAFVLNLMDHNTKIAERQDKRDDSHAVERDKTLTSIETMNERWAGAVDRNTVKLGETAGLIGEQTAALGELGKTFKCNAKPGGE